MYAKSNTYLLQNYVKYDKIYKVKLMKSNVLNK